MKIRFIGYKILTVMFAMQQACAYEFEFSNHTNYPLQIKIKLSGDLVTYETVIPPLKQGRKAMHTWYFGPGRGNRFVDAEWWKGGFCFDKLFVSLPLIEKKMGYGPNGEALGEIEEIIRDEVHGVNVEGFGKVAFGPYAEVAVTLVKDEGAQAIIDAAGELTGEIQNMTKDIANAAVQYSSSKNR